MPNVEKTKAAIFPCDSYDEEKAYDAVSKGIELIGGLDYLINKDEKIFVKPNLLSSSDPKKPLQQILQYLKLF